MKRWVRRACRFISRILTVRLRVLSMKFGSFKYPSTSSSSSIRTADFGKSRRCAPTASTPIIGPRSVMLGAAMALVATLATASIVRSDTSGIRASETRISVQDVTATVVMPQAKAASGERIPIAIDFDVASGWHIYGAPLPEDYTPTTVKFDLAMVARQTMNFPKPQQMNFKSVGETLPVYTGKFKANGAIWLKPGLASGDHKLPGTISFQECNDLLCKPPQQANFEIPISVAR